ncbi:ABC transporter permease [Paenibacillus sp.]|uniref:ABC transporter permease n=1 Tax=Paenibacillus sp. TaxID=58172 RepID=UPI002D3C4B4A|nr:ABC transporter permease [Paenibacillus sp.]HZG88406.1 ABC transporter permease [Paenibacillus sp.]
MKTRYLLPALIVLSAASVFVGVTSLTPKDLLSMTDLQKQILFASRLPRLASIIIAGMSMSIAGLIMQQLTRNKFVSPTTAGTDEAARLGVLVSILLFAGAAPMAKLLVAFAFALAGTFLFMSLLDRVKYKDSVFIPLVGLMFGSILGSATTFVAYKYELIQNVSAWLQGDFSLVMRGSYELLYLSVPVLVAAYVYANRFTVAGMGETFALNLGLNYRRVVNVGLVLVALISAVVLLTVGIIPFLGLIVPNLVTMYRGDHLRKSLTSTALFGAVFLLACDVLGRLVIYPYEIPIGLTVGVIGSGFFLYFIFRRRAL